MPSSPSQFASSHSYDFSQTEGKTLIFATTALFIVVHLKTGTRARFFSSDHASRVELLRETGVVVVASSARRAPSILFHFSIFIPIFPFSLQFLFFCLFLLIIIDFGEQWAIHQPNISNPRIGRRKMSVGNRLVNTIFSIITAIVLRE